MLTVAEVKVTLVLSPKLAFLSGLHEQYNIFELKLPYLCQKSLYLVSLHFFHSFMFFFMHFVHVIGFVNLSLLFSKDNSYRIAKVSIFTNKTFKPRTYHEAF